MKTQIFEKDTNYKIKQKNIDTFLDYFKKGCKPKSHANLGTEIEHIIVNKQDNKAISFYGEISVESILKKLQKKLALKEIFSNNYLIGVFCDDFYISLEPGAQLEISITPKKEILDIHNIYLDFLSAITPILDSYNCKLLYIGYQPVSDVRDIKLLPKKRYEFMDKYFQTSGNCGIHMMRGSASTQVSVDYFSEQDFVLKYRTAFTIMPVLKLITDNTPIFDKKPFKNNLARSYIWDNVDPARTGILPDAFDDDFGFLNYAKYLYSMPLIFDIKNQTSFYVGSKNAEDIYSSETMSLSQIEHVLSMTFLDVRLKKYIEIRFADSMPIKYTLSYIALIKGIFYSEDALKFISKFFPSSINEILVAQKNIVKHGFDGKIYGLFAYEFLNILFDFAEKSLNSNEKVLLNPLKELLCNKQTLAKKDLKTWYYQGENNE